MQDLNAKALEPNAPLPGKIIKWWQWYNQLIGMDTVEASRRQVIALQDKLFKCHDNRITLNKEFINITYKLQDLYAELLLTKREDPKFLQLTTEEHRSLQEKQKFLNQIELLEKEERDSFTQLATALKDYQVNQNLNAQKYKYLSIIASAIIAIASLIGSIVVNNKRILDVRCTIEVAQEKNMHELSNIQNMLKSVETKFSQQLANIYKKQEKVDAIDVKKETSNTSNILVSSAKYSANLLISGLSYIKKGIYLCGSYIFYK
ncbi:uncharacterized protein LOC105197435 isoform X3 [Solenopsis invicta]|nr:uncharacterized protein LOC105197435 isoform X3 [Solenopsis invicta]